MATAFRVRIGSGADAANGQQHESRKPNLPCMKPSVATAEAKPASKPDSQGRSEDPANAGGAEKKLGSSPDGLTQAEAAEAADAIRSQRDRGEERPIRFLKFLTYFWGPIPWMIEAAVILSAVVRHWLDFFIILLLLCSNAVVGFWEEHQAGNAIAALKAKLAIKARVKRDGKWINSEGARTGAGRRHPLATGRHRAGGCAPAGGRPGRGGSVRADGRVIARHAQTRRGGVFGVDHPPGRNRRDGVRHGREHLLRQDRATGAGGAHRQPFPAGRAEDRRLPDRAGGGSGRC